MRQLFALILVVGLWLNFAPPVLAVGAGLVPCSESPEFLQRAENARATTDTRDAQDRFRRYANNGALCGPEGLPRLIVDGRLDHLGDFTIPGIVFLVAVYEKLSQVYGNHDAAWLGFRLALAVVIALAPSIATYCALRLAAAWRRRFSRTLDHKDFPGRQELIRHRYGLVGLLFLVFAGLLQIPLILMSCSP